MKKLKVEWDRYGRILLVEGPAFAMVEKAVGEKDKYGDTITKYTPDWARVGYEPMADHVKMQNHRQSGHEIEGRVRIKGKSYSAFTSGAEMIIVRRRMRFASGGEADKNAHPQPPERQLVFPF